MFCGNCGSNVNENAVFCPNCGKSTGAIATEVQQPVTQSNPNQAVVFTQNIYSGGNTVKKRNYPLINLSAKLYYPFLEISLWILLIIGAIYGGVVGAREADVLGAVIGVIIGVVVIFFIIINGVGLLSIFLKIKEGIEDLNNKK